ncbi:related to dehydrogenases with different specificities (related to short-chain alcohol dehydrogenases) [Phialocephala subalpina]|uniref:Related to dehydrogenases with different specificities (Related to short-chain alcohol dehydrogenases) n=1 Tax=Phialocephala subalpina TaxID=576137 RepID=A0A1L7XT68_9HELO|nr:related to dehydrogenases with different specificities (related to short-chain alcohol dehydrogenases) [Phialocephala subalpina]
MSTSFFAQKHYIVTGGGSGIGLALVLKLAVASAIVHAIDLKASAPPEFEALLETVHYHGSIDVSSRSSVTELYKAITAISPRIDGVVNSAGICPGGDGYIQSDETFQRTMAVNVIGTWNITTAFLEMVDKESPNVGRTVTAPSRTRASIVNIGSSASLCAWPTLTAYTASKHAVLGLTRSWSLDWAHKGIRVNLVAPGGTDTPLARAQLSDPKGRGEALTAGLAMIPLGRLGRPGEQADTIMFLLGDGSSYITGQVIPVNGGFP